ncbi:Elevenin receptor 1 [Plakobranchus ocellatus]|uniref:Elevenin receptor 1 n=1 Tax=Plakobranchus ocellatus TaxID=259542 RepID=A0AAV4AV81_9GAST|nr:Elevenin receptor 1 [Plakobranchus ocellatus]
MLFPTSENSTNLTLPELDLSWVFSEGIDSNDSANLSSNGTTDDMYEYIYDLDAIDYIPLEDALPVTFTYSLTLLVGLVGNILVIFSILYYRRMRTTTNVFLLSLASADLLLILLCVPIKVSEINTKF